MSDHIFDILGIGSREDSYSNLIAYAFENLPDFRINLINNLNCVNHGDWKIYVRVPVPIISDSKRKKDVPDLVLVSKNGNEVTVIENKIHSKEGWKQTSRYASDIFKSSLTEYLKINNLLNPGPVIPEFKYFYLTLEGEIPSCDSFKAISYSLISKSISGNGGSSKLEVLLNELKERIDEYDTFDLPGDHEIVLDFLKNVKRLVTPYKAFCTLSDNLLTNSMLKKDYWIAANRGCGDIPLCQWSKTSWIGKEYRDSVSGNECYDIHFEFQWNRCEDSLRLYLHYHTNPYKTRKEFSNLNQEFKSGFYEARDDLLTHLNNYKPEGWIVKNTYLGLANITFEYNIRAGELKHKMRKITEVMVEAVDIWLSSKSEKSE